MYTQTHTHIHTHRVSETVCLLYESLSHTHIHTDTHTHIHTHIHYETVCVLDESLTHTHIHTQTHRHIHTRRGSEIVSVWNESVCVCLKWIYVCVLNESVCVSEMNLCVCLKWISDTHRCTLCQRLCVSESPASRTQINVTNSDMCHKLRYLFWTHMRVANTVT